MKGRYGFFFVFGMMTVLLPCLVSCSFPKSYPQDNFLEEAFEDVIELKTGIKMDLSGDSAE